MKEKKVRAVNSEAGLDKWYKRRAKAKGEVKSERERGKIRLRR